MDPKAHLVMSRDILVVTTVEGVLHTSKRWESMDTAKHPTNTQDSPQSKKKLSDPKYHSAEDEKPALN